MSTHIFPAPDQLVYTVLTQYSLSERTAGDYMTNERVPTLSHVHRLARQRLSKEVQQAQIPSAPPRLRAHADAFKHKWYCNALFTDIMKMHKSVSALEKRVWSRP